jgi:hypothetical protein
MGVSWHLNSPFEIQGEESWQDWGSLSGSQNRESLNGSVEDD